MMNLFDAAANDQSLYYLGRIFGNMGGVLPVTTGPILMGVMFKVLNTAALTVGAFIVVYTTVMGLLSTASEGEFLGKKWSGLWVPIRAVLGIVGLFPSIGGYCAIQIVIMWLVVQGIGLADTLWTTVLNVTQTTGAASSKVTMPDISGLVTPQLQNLFSGLVCYESVSYDTSAGSADSKDSSYTYPCATQGSADPRCNALPPFNSSQNTYNLAQCGTLTYCDPNRYPSGSMQQTLCKAQLVALPDIISLFDSVAKKFAQLDYQYQKFYYYSNRLNVDKTPQWIQDFCSKQGKKCCVQNAPDTTKKSAGPVSGAVASVVAFFGIQPLDNTTCSASFFMQQYSPNGTYNDPDKSEDKERVSKEALVDIYVPYGVQTYTDSVDFITAAANQYVGTLYGAYTSYLAQKPQGGLTGWQKESQNTGWVLAGMYFYKIAQARQSTLLKMSDLPTFTMALPDVSAKASALGKRNNLAVMPDLFNAINQAGGSSSAASPVLATVGNTTGMQGTLIVRDFMKYFSGNESGAEVQTALSDVAGAGWSLISGVQIAFWVTVAVIGVAAGLSAINFQVVGTGMTSNPASEVLKAVWGMISPFYMLGLSALFSMGVILGIYLPLVPYVIFTMGVVGWLIATIEAMVAGPIIALGILSPSGQHELLGKAEPAVMIIFNLVLRPGLMVFGLMASMFVASVVLTMLNQGFLQISKDIINDPGVIGGILIVVAYSSLLTMVLNKVFSLIHVVPERVLTYIGGQAISYGEGEGLAAMKQGLEGAASGVSGAGKEAGGAPAAAATKIGQDVAHKEHEAEAEKKKPGVSATPSKPGGSSSSSSGSSPT